MLIIEHVNYLFVFVFFFYPLVRFVLFDFDVLFLCVSGRSVAARNRFH